MRIRTLTTGCIGVAMAVAGALAMTPEARRSYEAFETRVNAGDPEAMFRMGTLLEQGFDSIPADSVRAVSMIRRSAEAGYAPAMNYLGYLYGEGRMVAADADSARYWIERASDAGDPRAALNLAFLLRREGRSTPDQILPLLERASSAGLPSAMLQLGELLREEGDTARADRLRMDAAETYFRGSAPEQGVYLASEISADTLVADTERARAYRLIGDAISLGRGAGYNHSESLRNYQRAAELGDSIAARIVAETLEIFPDALR